MTYLTDILASWALDPQEGADLALHEDPVNAVLELGPDQLQTLLETREAVLARGCRGSLSGRLTRRA